MTDLFLRDKKLLNETINEFIFSNELFANQLTDSISSLRESNMNKGINTDDKYVIYEFYKENENNMYFHKKMICDFIEFINFLNDLTSNKDNKITKETKICNIIESKDITSNNFKKLFECQGGLTVDKTIEIFDYYLKLISKNVIQELKDYQEELDDETIRNIDKYYSTKHLIRKKDFSYAIRLFMILVLFLEEDKENKIRFNRNNIMNYLYSSDLWKKDIFNAPEFSMNINELKTLNIKINQIASLYKVLGKDFEDDYFDDVKQRLKQIEKYVHRNNDYEEDINDE